MSLPQSTFRASSGRRDPGHGTARTDMRQRGALSTARAYRGSRSSSSCLAALCGLFLPSLGVIIGAPVMLSTLPFRHAWTLEIIVICSYGLRGPAASLPFIVPRIAPFLPSCWTSRCSGPIARIGDAGGKWPMVHLERMPDGGIVEGTSRWHLGQKGHEPDIWLLCRSVRFRSLAASPGSSLV